MTIFGSLEILKKQITDDKFKVAFKYLTKVLDEVSEYDENMDLIKSKKVIKTVVKVAA